MSSPSSNGSNTSIDYKNPQKSKISRNNMINKLNTNFT